MITAIVLAAGQSTRMGSPKMLLPWGSRTVIEKVIATLKEAGLDDICVVTGSTHPDIIHLLPESGVRIEFNKDYANGEMLTSMQVGIRCIGSTCEAILVVLGDQPQMEVQVVAGILKRFESTKNSIIVPSYKMHRGHPWLLGKDYWDDILNLLPPLTLRDFLNEHNDRIDYMEVETPSVIQDLDTQKDYLKHRP